ncbi:MAG: lysylphosphatidylglycerol synthase domain-containing protein, partial [Terriglobia bacterium]
MARFSEIWREITRFAGAAEPCAEAGVGCSRPPEEDPERGKAKRKKAKAWLGKALAYGLAAAIIAALARGISAEQFARVLKEVNPGLFLLACVGSFLFWFLGDTVSLARLFSYFHVNTTFREMLPGNTAQYFLQTINHVAGGTALAIFMRRSKGVPIVSAGCSMMFLGLIDFLVMGLMGLAAAALVPASLLSAEWYYPAAVTGGIGLFVWFWLRGRPNWRIARRIYDLPSFESIRNARVSHYLRLMLLRGLLFTAEALTLFV